MEGVTMTVSFRDPVVLGMQYKPEALELRVFWLLLMMEQVIKEEHLGWS